MHLIVILNIILQVTSTYFATLIKVTKLNNMYTVRITMLQLSQPFDHITK